MEADVQNLVLKVKSSDIREQILKDLYHRKERVRPSKILEALEPQMETSSGNFYMNLGKLNDMGLVEKIEGDSRATLYSLTDTGHHVAEELQDEWAAQDSATNPEPANASSTTSQTNIDQIPESTDEQPVDPDFVNTLARWLANRSEGPDDVIKAAQELKQEK